MNRRAFLTTSLGATLALAGCGGSRQSDDIMGKLAGNDQFSVLIDLVETANLDRTLYGPGPFTVFAPTNAAFANYAGFAVEELKNPANRDKLVQILTYHGMAGAIPSAQLTGQVKNMVTLQGQVVKVDGTGGRIRVNGANIVNADITASNGIIHVVDALILPN